MRPHEQKTQSLPTEDSQFFIWAAAITIGILIGGMSVAILSGAMLYPHTGAAPAWVQAIISLASAAISAVAVMLVRSTLHETRETLRVTSEMARDQKEYQDKQVRPWVIPVEPKALFDRFMGHEYLMFHVEMRNMGQTPTGFFYVNIYAHFYTNQNHYEADLMDLPHDCSVNSIERKDAYLHGNGVHQVEVSLLSDDVEAFYDLKAISIFLSWSYPSALQEDQNMYSHKLRYDMNVYDDPHNIDERIIRNIRTVMLDPEPLPLRR